MYPDRYDPKLHFPFWTSRKVSSYKFQTCTFRWRASHANGVDLQYFPRADGGRGWIFNTFMKTFSWKSHTKNVVKYGVY